MIKVFGSRTRKDVVQICHGFLRWERGDRKGLLHEVVSELRTEQVCILRAEDYHLAKRKFDCNVLPDPFGDKSPPSTKGPFFFIIVVSSCAGQCCVV